MPKLNTVKLTAASVEKHTARKVRREIPDGACPGLYLIVQPSGVKSFALRFRNASRRTVKLTLGKVDLTGTETSTAPMIGMPLTLLAARRLAVDLHRQRIMGNDLVATRRREKLERRAGTVNTFSQCALDFTEQHLRRHTRQWQRTARYLGVVETGDEKNKTLTLLPRGLADRWRDRPVSEITSDDIHHIIDETREKAAPGLKRKGKRPSQSMARVMRTTLSGMFSWLLEKRRITTSPMNGTSVPKKKTENRTRVLRNDEIIAFWNTCNTMREPIAQCLKLLLLTGCRRDEIGKLRRVEISQEGSAITIPGTRTKNKKEFVIPLPQLARDILCSVQSSGDQVFTKSRTLAWSRIKAELDAKLQFATPWVLHDLRRTFATGLNSFEGIGSEVVEAALNHISGTKSDVAGVYNQYAYLPEKEKALQRWADHVMRLVEGRTTDKVVALRR